MGSSSLSESEAFEFLCILKKQHDLIGVLAHVDSYPSFILGRQLSKYEWSLVVATHTWRECKPLENRMAVDNFRKCLSEAGIEK